MHELDWMHTKLANWARWCTSGSFGALGFPKQSTFVRLAPSSSSAEAVIPLDDLDASKLDQLIKAMQHKVPELYLTIWLTYVGDPDARPRARVPLEVPLMAQRMGCAKATVYARRLQAVRLLAQMWQASAKNGFTH